jgi:hypothetical protein
MPAADSVGRRAWPSQAIPFPSRCRDMNTIRWIAFGISGVAILTFTQFPYAASMQTRVEYAAEQMNYKATVKSKSGGEIAAATQIFAK